MIEIFCQLCEVVVNYLNLYYFRNLLTKYFCVFEHIELNIVKFNKL